MVTLLVRNNIQKPKRKTRWKQRYRWKQYRSMTRRNVQHFPPASGRMAFVYYVTGKMVGSTVATSVDARGDSSNRKKRVFKRLNGNVSSEWISLRFASENGTASSIKNCIWFYAYKKYRNGNSARRQRHIRPYPAAEMTISGRQYPENN